MTSPKGQSKQIVFSEPTPPKAQRLDSTSIESVQDYDPKLDTPFTMADFTGGVGQLEFDYQDETQYWWATGVVTHANGKAYPAPPQSSLALTGATGDVTGMCTYITTGNVRYDFLWEGLNLWRRDATNATNAWGKVYTASFAITDFHISDGIGFIATPTETDAAKDFFYQTDITAAATWTPTAANHTVFSVALGKPIYFGHVRGTTYAAVSPSKVFYTTTPTTDGWAGPIDTTLTGNISGSPGDDTYNFIGLRAVGDFLFVIKRDAIYSIDSQQDVIEAIWQWKDKPSEYNFPHIATGGSYLFFDVGPEAYYYDPTSGAKPAVGLARKPGFATKKILGVAADNQYLYVLAQVRVPVIRSADSVALFRCMQTRNGQWVPEVIWEDSSLSGKSYGGLWAFPFGVGTRIYWGNNNASDTTTCLMDIPAEWDETSSGAFTATSSLYTSISRAGFAGFTKRHLYFNANGLSLSASPANKITPYYSIDNGANFVAMTALTAANTIQSFSNINSASIMFRFDFASAGTVAPVLSNFDHHQRIRMKYLPTIQATVRLAKGIRVRNQGVSNKEVWEIWDYITTLRTTNSEITYKDFLGNSFPVTVDMIAVQPTRHEAPLEYEEEAVLMMTRCDKGG